MKLSLGTAQFGMNYGINNSSGQVSYSDAKKIIHICQNKGINFIDTAMHYGNSEEILGKIGVNNFNIISKISTIPKKLEDKKKWIEDRVFSSLKKLKVKRLYALLFHDANEFKKEENYKILKSLDILKSKGLIQKIGVSVYDPEEIKTLFNHFPFEIVQVPYNIIDQRLKKPEIINFVKSNKIEIQSRSIFLQGVLFMNRQQLLKKFKSWENIWNTWFKYIDDNKILPLEICLSHQKQFSEIKIVNIGVDTPKHLNQIIKSFENLIEITLPDITSSDLDLIDPRRWNL